MNSHSSCKDIVKQLFLYSYTLNFEIGLAILEQKIANNLPILESWILIDYKKFATTVRHKLLLEIKVEVIEAISAIIKLFNRQNK